MALSGTGYAAVKVNGSDLENRSVAGKKLKRDTIGGREVNESKLGRVPSALNATRANSAATSSSATTAGSATSASHATSADHATSAGFASRAGGATSAETATHATSATQATNATQAGNAALLDGLGSDDFLAADTIVSGIAALATSNQNSFASPDMGFAVNRDRQPEGDPFFEVEVRNTRAAGGAPIAVGLSTSNLSFTVAPGDFQEIENPNNVFPTPLGRRHGRRSAGCARHLRRPRRTNKVYCYGVRT